MKSTKPEIFLIASPHFNETAAAEYLEKVGGEQWIEGRQLPVPAAQTLIEFAGRLCYRSWIPGLNKNVTKIRTDPKKYFLNLLQSRHGSVLEHANYTFVFHNVSRVFTHELVRHRAGVAISQESLRYVRLGEINFRVPPALEPLKGRIKQYVETIEEIQIALAEELELDKMPFHEKKVVTSALRRLAPEGLSTDIVWTANVRTIRHVIEMRTDPGAEEEIRYVFDKVAKVMKAECPLLFQDFKRQKGGSWSVANSKV